MRRKLPQRQQLQATSRQTAVFDAGQARYELARHQLSEPVSPVTAGPYEGGIVADIAAGTNLFPMPPLPGRLKSERPASIHNC
ncbi:hypothetical protein BCAR13_1060143 [Paraburkholderia caribensis]|nr:hypothetical protein BCAR13_1060143 [Paraburkholderia caribensis]